jgi:hypothetical protein
MVLVKWPSPSVNSNRESTRRRAKRSPAAREAQPEGRQAAHDHDQRESDDPQRKIEDEAHGDSPPAQSACARRPIA